MRKEKALNGKELIGHHQYVWSPEVFTVNYIAIHLSQWLSYSPPSQLKHSVFHHPLRGSGVMLLKKDFRSSGIAFIFKVVFKFLRGEGRVFQVGRRGEEHFPPTRLNPALVFYRVCVFASLSMSSLYFKYSLRSYKHDF